MTPHSIVLADPDALKRQAYCRVLRAAGFDVIDLASVDEVFVSLRSQRPALVVLSMRLWDDSTLSRRLIYHLASTLIPSLLLVPAEVEEDFPKDGADGYLVEPFTDTELTAYVRVLLHLSISI